MSEYVQSMFKVCSEYVQSMYKVSSEYVQGMYMYRLCSEYVLGMFRVCSEYVRSMLRVCSEYVQSSFRVGSECVQSVFRVCSECAQSMFRVCSILKSFHHLTHLVCQFLAFLITGSALAFRVCLWIITSDIQQRYLNYEVEGQNIGISNILSVTAPFWASPCADRNCIASVTKKGKP